MKLNVDHSNPDPFYRYKMPAVQIKIEGKGGGCKTVFLNLIDVAEALKRNPEHILKHIGYELGTQTKIDNNFRCIVSGSHDSKKLQSLVYSFIDKYVICGFCNNPETFYVVSKGLKMECYACGHKTKIEGRLVNTLIKEAATPSLLQESKNENYVASQVNYTEIFVDDDSIFIENIFVTTNNLSMELGRIREGARRYDSLLPALEMYLVRMGEEEMVCKYLDMFVRENFVRKSKIHEYFSEKSKVIDKGSSNSIRAFLKAYFDD